MSAIRSYEQVGAGGSGASIEVPKSFQPDGDTVLINSDSRLFEYPASVSTFSPAGVSQIIIPQHRSRYILGGTSYLSFRLTIDTGSVTLPAASSARYNPCVYFTGGPTKSAAALVDRVTVSASNGQVLADITNYAQWHNIILSHAANEDYGRNASISEFAFSPVILNQTVGGAESTTATFSASVDISLPLAIGMFQEAKAFPLWALNGPLIIMIQWSNAAKSLGIAPQQYEPGSWLAAAVPAATVVPMTAASLTYSGLELTYRCRCVDVDTDYIQQQRAMMMAGKVLTFNYRQVQGLTVKPTTSGISFNFGINCSSLLAVFGATLMDKDAAYGASSCDSKFGNDALNKGSWGFSPNGQQNVRVYRDGTQLSTFPVNRIGRDDAFIPLMEALGVLFSTSNASAAKRCVTPGFQYVSNYIDNYRVNNGGIGGRVIQTFNLPIQYQYGDLDGGSVYSPNSYVWGLSARMCNDAEVINKGSACSQLQITVDSMTSAAAMTYIFYAYSCSMSFDATGNVMVRR